jgi:hypothetical protein
MKLLKIENFGKLILKDVHRYRIGGAVETNSHYVVKLFHPGEKSFPVYLERQSEMVYNPKKNLNYIGYKMWFEKQDRNIVESLYWESTQFKTPDDFLSALNVLIM